jgi:hypothetical protein
MKKLESVLNDLLGCGKPNLPKKFTMKEGEGTITALEKPIELAFSRRKSVKFDITIK